jgi:threonine dehydrogenase-like Zn-dependent dehydrogenase
VTGRRLVLDGPGRLRVEAAPQAVAVPPGHVRVAPAAVGICGSDVHGYAGTNDRRAPGVVMGHEAAGHVVALGPGVDGPPVGTPVALNPVVTCGRCPACRAGRDNLCAQRRLYGCVPELPGAFADRVDVRAANVVALRGPAPVPWAALAEPLAVGAHAVRVGGIGPADRVVVVGGGPIGAGAAFAARRAGAPEVLVVEPDAHRRTVLARLGLDAVEPSAVAPEAADVALECVGVSATVAAALAAVAPGATVVVVGMAAPELTVAAAALVMGERRLAGSAVYTRADFEATAGWIDAGEVDLEPLLEARVDLPGVADAFRGYADGSLRAMKTLWVSEPAPAPGR